MPQQSNNTRMANPITQDAFRKPQRMTITIPFGVHETLVAQSNYQGRSLSNYAAFIIEQALVTVKDAQNHRLAQ
jgi:hypothetical protein